MNKINKKFVSGLLAVTVAATSFTSVFAASSNSITRIDSVKEDSVIENVDLKIKPTSAVESGSSIILTLENAEFDEDKIEKETGKTLAELIAYKDSGLIKPYEFKRINDSEAQIFLGAITREEADIDPAPYYLIPIVAVANSEEDVKVKIDSNGTVISSTTHTVATSTSEDGKTTTKVNKERTFSDTLYVDTITVKEDVYGTFKEGTVKVRVNGGFKIVDSDIQVEPGVNLTGAESVTAKIDDNGSYISFDIPESWTKTKNAASFTIKGIKIEPDDEDKNFGDVRLTISGSSANITKETITVGSRQDYGFEFEVVNETPTILSGRTYTQNKDLDKEDFKTAKVKFAELTVDTWLTNRKLEFTVPEGVKIVDAEFTKIKNIVSLDDYASIANDGRTLKIDKGVELKSNRKSDEQASFEMELYLSVDADFTGDVELAVKGGGIAEDTIPALTIAEAVTPIKVDAVPTTVNLGYQTFTTGDITITETQDGALLDGEEVIIAFDDKNFGNSELGFNDVNVEYTIDGELEIKDFKVSNGAITFKVDKTSNLEPSTITISNVTVGTTRAVPYGTFSLKISGDAVINNYAKNVKDIYPVKLDKVEEKDNEDITLFDTVDGYVLPDYVSIITQTGTFDTTVKVTIGSQEIEVNGELFTVDTTPYIQATTNSTLVPLRVVAVALNGGDIESADECSNIAFDAESKTATIIYQGKIVQFQAGSAYMVVDGTTIANDNGAVAEITDGRLYVPYRSLGTALGVPVTWDAEARTAQYN